MWGICLDILVDGGNLYQKVIEYQVDLDNRTVNILQPAKDIKISLNDIEPIKKPPVFIYGDFVSPINHPDMLGKIETIIWHFKNKDYLYYISVNGKKKSKRYYAKDLNPHEIKFAEDIIDGIK